MPSPPTPSTIYRPVTEESIQLKASPASDELGHAEVGKQRFAAFALARVVLFAEKARERTSAAFGESMNLASVSRVAIGGQFGYLKTH
ncbi:hypothetical protein DL765_011131 [Monosporascus sp. GIB2]|nr:hypothetical protein DL765_011131 [Monosporascus sp. GIB2]